MKLIAFIAPTPAMMFPHGTHNGYVAVPPEHPLYGKDMFDDAMEALDVHGGITLSDAVIMPSEDNGIKIDPQYIGKRHPLLKKAQYLTEEKTFPMIGGYWDSTPAIAATTKWYGIAPMW